MKTSSTALCGLAAGLLISAVTISSAHAAPPKHSPPPMKLQQSYEDLQAEIVLLEKKVDGLEGKLDTILEYIGELNERDEEWVATEIDKAKGFALLRCLENNEVPPTVEAASAFTTRFVSVFWADQSDSGNEVMAAAITGELSDCTIDSDASLEQQYGFRSACLAGKWFAANHNQAWDLNDLFSLQRALSLELFSSEGRFDEAWVERFITLSPPLAP